MTPLAPHAFHWREGRRHGPAETAAVAGTTLELDEGRDYFLRFAAPLTPEALTALKDVGYEPFTDTTGVLSFGNFVGVTDVANVRVRVRSRKLSEQAFQALLGETASLSAELIYGWRSPSGFGAARTAPSRRRLRFHDLLLLRHAMLGLPPGERLQDAFDALAASPTRRFVSLYRDVPSWHAQELDAGGLAAMAQHPEWLTPVRPGTGLYDHPLARRLHPPSRPAARHFPLIVREPARQLSFDTVENRFVRTVLEEAAETVAYFVDHQALSESLRAECRGMQVALEQMGRAAFLEGVGRLRTPPVPTQALLKQAGYREVFELYRVLSSGHALPPSEAEAQRFMDGKDVATLYEYWVFLRVVRALEEALGEAGTPVTVEQKDELGVLLAPGTRVTFPCGLTAAYNQRFERDADDASYSLAFKPDVTVDWQGRRCVLDAKYRLAWVPTQEGAAEADADEEEEDAGRTFKRIDLYKMHSYRDALARVESAWVVYPGDVFSFFEASGRYRDVPEALATFSGVGALPLRPGASADLLGRLVARMLRGP